MADTVFDELKRFVEFGPADEQALRALHPLLSPHFGRVAEAFYQRILEHPDTRAALEHGAERLDRLRLTLVAWMGQLFQGPWDDAYFALRCRIGQVHVRHALPQHLMFGAMNVVRRELVAVLDQAIAGQPGPRSGAHAALAKILDLELAIMLHTYREDLLEQKARSARLSTFGQLVGSIGHELRNPLGVIETSLFILRGRVEGDERALKHVERIGEQLGIANAIVTSLLDMIRDRPLARQRLLLDEVVRSAAEVVPCPAPVRLTLGPLEGTRVEGDASQLRQVFVNLLENAVHAASPEGEVRVVRLEGAPVRIAVEDSGPGVDPAIFPRLFEPLVTTKAKGTGLGLALVKRILERHGGAIGYAARPGGGSRFVVELPEGR